MASEAPAALCTCLSALLVLQRPPEGAVGGTTSGAKARLLTLLLPGAFKIVTVLVLEIDEFLFFLF